MKKNTVSAPMTDASQRARSAMVTMGVGLGVNIALFIVKLYVGLASNSLAVMGDALNNLGDTIACSIAVISFALVAKSRDDKLEFGYGRMEYLASFLMAMIVCAVGAGFIYSAVERLILPYLMTFTWLYFGIIAATAAVKAGLGIFYRMRNKSVDSGVLRAAALDSFTDVGITVMSLIGFSLNRYAKLRLDAVFGLVISGIMLFNGIKLLVSSIKTLLGDKIDASEREKIGALCMSYDCVSEIKSVHLHKYGAGYAELIIEAVFTSGENYDIISTAVEELTALLKKEFGYEPKICISR